LGSVLGDGVIIGEEAFVHPGVMLDPNTSIAPKSLVAQ
jgi:UDP-3-O-[3-hydroxymyristoyl] glucosamine N-acyltransferase